MNDNSILIIHGPNLNFLGKREPNIYGSKNLKEINENLIKIAKKNNFNLEIFFSNYEGKLIDFIEKKGKNTKGLIINPASFTHTSIAIRDAILAQNFLTIEVHLSNLYKRELFRQKSYFHDISKGIVMGFGAISYEIALRGLILLLNNKT